MKEIIYFLTILLMISGCSTPKIAHIEQLPKTTLTKSDFKDLPNWDQENYLNAFEMFVKSCDLPKTKKLYGATCEKANDVQNVKEFIENNFQPYRILTKDDDETGLLTGYYEPQLHGSLEKKYPYIYPIYEKPKDLIDVELSSIYPQLKNFRLRGRLVGDKLVPYYERSEIDENDVNASVICYTDSKIDLFFLEIQGSGRVLLDNNETIYVGYADQNGHRYRAIGRYLVEKGELSKEEVSLQSIKAWLLSHPERIDEVLNYNKSVVYFKQKERPASGALGVVLTPKRSIAVDRRYIPLGSMLYMHSDEQKNKMSQIVMAQDTGGAIKGSVRADIFLGYGDDAMQIAGELKAPLELWILLPKNSEKEENL